MRAINHTDSITGLDACDRLHNLMMTKAADMAGTNFAAVGSHYNDLYDMLDEINTYYGESVYAIWDNPRAVGPKTRATKNRVAKFAAVLGIDPDYCYELIELAY